MPQLAHPILKKEGKKSVKVLSSDTDVFALLCFHFANHWPPKDVYTFFFYKQSKIQTIAPKTSNLLNHFQTIYWDQQEMKIKQSTAKTG